MQAQASLSLGGFVQRLLLTILFGAFAYALWRMADLALLSFGAALIALALRSGALRIARWTGLGTLVALGVVVVLLLVATGACLWFFGTIAADQIDELGRQVPIGMRLLIARIESYTYGRYVLAQIQTAGTAGAPGWVAGLLGSLAQGLARGAGYAVLTFFVAMYLAAQPALYRKLCMRLLPPTVRPQASTLITRSAAILRSWMLAQLFVMVVVGTLSGIGLWVLGIEAPFALGLIGGLLTFVPYAGPIMAAVPATLVALTQGPEQAGTVVLMYMAVHFLEGNFITPLVQAEATSLPPVLALLSAVGFSVLFGVSGMLLAAPLMLFVIVAVDVLWVEQELKGKGALLSASLPQPE